MATVALWVRSHWVLDWIQFGVSDGGPVVRRLDENGPYDPAVEMHRAKVNVIVHKGTIAFAQFRTAKRGEDRSHIPDVETINVRIPRESASVIEIVRVVMGGPGGDTRRGSRRAGRLLHRYLPPVCRRI